MGFRNEVIQQVKGAAQFVHDQPARFGERAAEVVMFLNLPIAIASITESLSQPKPVFHALVDVAIGSSFALVAAVEAYAFQKLRLVDERDARLAPLHERTPLPKDTSSHVIVEQQSEETLRETVVSQAHAFDGSANARESLAFKLIDLEQVNGYETSGISLVENAQVFEDVADILYHEKQLGSGEPLLGFLSLQYATQSTLLHQKLIHALNLTGTEDVQNELDPTDLGVLLQTWLKLARLRNNPSDQLRAVRTAYALIEQGFVQNRTFASDSSQQRSNADELSGQVERLIDPLVSMLLSIHDRDGAISLVLNRNLDQWRASSGFRKRQMLCNQGRINAIYTLLHEVTDPRIRALLDERMDELQRQNVQEKMDEALDDAHTRFEAVTDEGKILRDFYALGHLFNPDIHVDRSFAHTRDMMLAPVFSRFVNPRNTYHIGTLAVSRGGVEYNSTATVSENGNAAIQFVTVPESYEATQLHQESVYTYDQSVSRETPDGQLVLRNTLTHVQRRLKQPGESDEPHISSFRFGIESTDKRRTLFWNNPGVPNVIQVDGDGILQNAYQDDAAVQEYFANADAASLNVKRSF